MAGGMRRGQGLPMRERVRQGRAMPEAPEEPCPGRHCWVVGGVGADGDRKRPGLLVEWRESAEGWQGRVVYLALAGPGRWVLAEEWLPAACLAPA